ncbi:MAG: META domain-containing protein [Deltaproteobacteria bacterium]|nr:META domain-containing protein [Deltaproteobacteria bacterium]
MSEQPIPDTTGALADTEWRIEDIVGRAVIEEAPATLRIEADGRVSGRTGCNLFTGSVQVRADAIQFGPLATTRSICPPALMDQEQRLLNAFEAARAFSIDESGLLHLKGEYEPFLLRASPVRRRE